MRGQHWATPSLASSKQEGTHSYRCMIRVLGHEDTRPIIGLGQENEAWCLHHTLAVFHDHDRPSLVPSMPNLIVTDEEWNTHLRYGCMHSAGSWRSAYKGSST